MKFVPPSDVDALPNAEWHGGVVGHELELRGVSQGVKNVSPSRTRVAKKSTALSVIVWLALWSLLLLPTLQGFVPVADDLGAYHLPLRAYYQSALQAGDNWTWCPWIFGGYHMHGEGQIGGDHPLHQLLYRALPLHWAFGLECWWGYPATFFGMWWWLRQLRLSTLASQTGALAFSLCGYMTLRVVHVNAIQVIAHLPWLLGCLTWLEHRVRHTSSLRSILPPIACSGLLTGSQLLLGYPQYVVFTLITESLWATTLMVRLKQRSNSQISPSPMTKGNIADNNNAVWKFAFAWIAAKALGLLLGASQVMPTLEYLSLSERMNWSAKQMFEGSWPLLNLTQLVAPYLFTNRVVGQNTHELTIFMGFVPVCLAVLGLVNRTQRSFRAIKGFALALCAVSLLLALGDMSPLADVMPYIPVWNRFRFPCRATLLLCIGIAILAALGCQRIFALAKLPKSRLDNANSTIRFSETERRCLHGLLCISILVPIYGSIAWREHMAAWHFTLVGAAGFLLSWVVIYLASTASANRRLFMLAVGIELLLYAGTNAQSQSMMNIAWNIDFNEHRARRSDREDHVSRTIASSNAMRCNLNMAPHLLRQDSKVGERLSPYATIDGYAGVYPRRQLAYDLDHPGAIAAAGVTNVYSPSADRPIDLNRRLECSALSRGTLVIKTEPAIQPARRIEQLDLQHVALVADYLGLSPPAANDRLQIEVVTDRPGHLAFALDTNRDALLVTTESFHPGWRVRVDGVEMPALQVNGDFLGVRVPPAAQRLECYFSDNWHAVGRWISLGSLGLLGLGLCLTLMRQNALGFVR